MRSVCAIDVGTTRSKAALVDERGTLIALVARDTPGVSARDPDHAVNAKALPGAVFELLAALAAQAPASLCVEGICVTGQRATFFARDRDDSALAALSWQDPRSVDDLAALAAEMPVDRYQAITGLPPSPIAVLTRFRWLRRCRPQIASATRRVALVADTVLEALGAPEGLMDPSNASATGFWDLARGEYSLPLVRLAGLESAQLPRVVPAGTLAGGLGAMAAAATGLSQGTPLLVGGGDQPCATLGMGVTEPGELGLCMGTSADLTTPIRGVAELLPGRINTAHVVAGETLLEGFVASFGAALDFCRALLSGSPHTTDADLSVQLEDDPFFLPFLTGIATPDFAPGVRGGLVGLAHAHGPAAVTRAVREGLALELRRILESTALPSGLETLVACGAVAEDQALLGRIATVTRRPLLALETSEAALRGAACLAWYGLGRYSSPTEAARVVTPGSPRRYVPGPKSEVSERRYSRYCRLVARLLEDG